MRKRHIGEFRKTELANNGRAAGIGIVEDKFDDESFPDSNRFHPRRSAFEHHPQHDDGEVITLNAERA